jgi:hypothetical protein
LKDDIFGLRLVTKLSYVERFWFLFRGFFEDYIFAVVKYLSFHDSSFALRNFLM